MSETPDNAGRPADAPPGGTPGDTPGDRPPPFEGTYGAQTGPDLPRYPQAGPGEPGYGPPAYAAARPEDLLAGRWARLGGGILDGLVVGFVSVPLVLPAVRWGRLQDAAETGETLGVTEMYNIPLLMIGYAVSFLLGFAYYTVCHVKWGQTLGKKAVGIRVVRAEDHGAVGWGRSCARQGFVYLFGVATALLNLAGPVGGLAGLAGLLDNAWILWDPKRQAVHDKVGRTVVIKAAPWFPNPYKKA
ncbi:RDD family protein [Spirillospora albida]|uniref:RDD family protein n=1 Tax=Spirillospora albida TaxID=58123 RepID=UPI0004C04998|nr:RDD family protein [Spirillospora albida]